MIFTWWDDAVAWAVSMARDTQLKHKVSGVVGGWAVDLADKHVTEPCS